MIVYEALKKTMQNRTTFGEIKSCIKTSLEPFLFQKTKRAPIIIPVILNQKEAMKEIQGKVKLNKQKSNNRPVHRKPKAGV